MDDIQEVILQIANSFVQVEQNLNTAGYDRLVQFAPLWELMRTTTPELADSLIPSTLSAGEAVADLDFQFRRHNSKESEVEVSILNLGYSAKFDQARFGRCHIQLSFRRVDLNERRPISGQPND
jgi:hypothetical protein